VVTRARLLLTILICLPATAPVARQQTAGEPPRDWSAWLAAVNAHVPGERDDAVTAIAPWSLDELDALLPEVPKQPDQGVRLVERGLVLHMDIALMHRNAAGYDLPPGPGGVTLFSDGRAVGQMSRTIHWEFARRLVDRVSARADRVRIGRAFYRATGAVLQLWGEYPELATHLADGRRAIGDDAVLLLYEGTMRQAYASPRVQRFFDERRRAAAAERPTMNTRLPPGQDGTAPREIISLPAGLPSARDSRGQAERLFRRALAIDPGLAEARIRLAHVLGDAGRHDEAAAELDRARTASLPALLDYYASLLAGREARARGRFDAARLAFERAASLYPTAPAPKFGLSELAIARNDPAAGLAHLQPTARDRSADIDDPWWWIDRAHSPPAESLVIDLRRTAPE
jgi:tetratricopeptide (TPR) repeat protein